MSNSYQQIMEHALSLPATERVALAEIMLESVGEQEIETLSQEEWDAAWKVEVKRRLDRIEQGTVKFYSWDEIEQRLNHRLNSAQTNGHD